MSSLIEPFKLPSISLPNSVDLPRPKLSIPTADIPSYKPLAVPPSDLRAPPGVKQKTNKEIKTEPPKPPQIDIPILDIPVPVPSPEVLVTAVTTAVAAVATTTLAQPLFDTIKKKVQKFLQGKINKWKQKRQKKKDSSES